MPSATRLASRRTTKVVDLRVLSSYVAPMDRPRPAAVGPADDRCTALRSAVATSCDAAGRARREHLAISEQLRESRRRSAAAERDQAMAVAAADPQLRREEKLRAREIYEHARANATTEAARTEAVADWLRALDRVNRSASLARRAVRKANVRSKLAEDDLHVAERKELAARVAAEAREAECLDARVRLAACEEQLQRAPASVPLASPFAPHAATGGHAVAIPHLPRTEPLVVEAMVAGDRRALELAAAAVAAQAGLSPAKALLQLQEFVDAVTSLASLEGYLRFDTQHRFWSHLSLEEAGDVVAALARQGFQFVPAEGWHAGRSPTPSDLSRALAYAGLDARSMRDLPTADELRRLPDSISVDARSFLAQVAPELAIDQLVNALGRRAKPLESLWDVWGQVRPILLSDRHSLGTMHG